MKKIVGMNLGLENAEKISLRLNEFEDLGIDNINESVAQIGSNVFQFSTCDFAHFRLKARADHTYKSFGGPSELTIFNRLTVVSAPVTSIELVYDNKTTLELLILDTMRQIFDVDDHGDMDAIFILRDIFDEDEGPCDLCCEECDRCERCEDRENCEDYEG